MRKKHFSNIFIYFMIFNLLFGQSHTLYSLHAEETLISSDDAVVSEAKENSDPDKKADTAEDKETDKANGNNDEENADAEVDSLDEKKADNLDRPSEVDKSEKNKTAADSDEVESSLETKEALSNDNFVLEEADQSNPAVVEDEPDSFMTKNSLEPEATTDQSLVSIEKDDAFACQCPQDYANEIDNEDVDEKVTEKCQEECSEISVENINEAVISDDVETVSNTGNNNQGASVQEGENHGQNQEVEKNNSKEDEGGIENENILENQNQNQNQEDGVGEIITGAAMSVAVVENNINTNIVTQNGSYSNTDIYGDYIGNIDLLGAFQTIVANTKEQNNSNASAISIAIENVNKAEVKNDVSTVADTGGNQADGQANISTGNATSITDIVNYINTNIIGDNWLFATVNIFGNWVGNLIVPGEGLITTSAPRIFSDVAVVNENSAMVENNVVTASDTGNNSASVNDAIIQSGSAAAETKIVNIVNTNIIKNNWFLLLINNMGSWSGTLLNWGDENSSDVLAYDLGSYDPVGAPSGGSLSVHNCNEAQIENNVVTTATTGDNAVSGLESNAAITTGNAAAFSNVFNMINTNIIGDNWFFGVVNNMGSWQGNVEFAYPDLDISVTDGLEQAELDQTIDYTIRYKNIGLADSGSTKISLAFSDNLLVEETFWDLPEMKAGEEKTFIVQAKIKDDANLGGDLGVTAKISTTTKEVNLDNNQSADKTTLITAFQNINFSEDFDLVEYEYDIPDSEISIKRSSNVGKLVKPGDKIENTIVVTNNGDSTVYNISVNDKMLDENGALMANYYWPIGTMKKGGKIMIQYELLVNNPGHKVDIEYVAKADGEDGYGEKVLSHSASSLLTIVGFAMAAQASDMPVDFEVIQPEEDNLPDLIFGGVDQSTQKLPNWIWLMTIVAFYLTINWSLFPKKNNSVG